MRGATSVTLPPHQIPRLPHRMTRMLDRLHIWNLIYNARSNRCHHPTSPNIAPATQNDSHAWSSSHMKRHLQCAEQQVSPSNLTKYCACHTEWLACLIVVTYETSFTISGATGVTIQPHQILRLPRKKTLQDVKENLQKQVKRHFQCGADPTMIRPWSENLSMIRAWSENEKRKPQPASQVRLLCEVPRSIFYCKIQRFATNLTVKLSPNTAPATKSDTTTSPKYCACHEKVPLERHQVLHLPRKMTRLLYRPHNMKPSFPMRGAAGVTIQPRHILRLPRKMTLQDVKENLQKQVKRHFQCGADPTMIRPWSEHDPSMIREWKRKPQPASQVRLLCEVPRSIFYCKIQRFAPNLTVKLSPNTAPATKSDTTNFTKYCACHEKCHLNVTKYCTCHEKWHLNFTK